MLLSASRTLHGCEHIEECCELKTSSVMSHSYNLQSSIIEGLTHMFLLPTAQ